MSRPETARSHAGMQAELGVFVKGTSDAALVLRQSVQCGVAANGIQWLWEHDHRLPASSSVLVAYSIFFSVSCASSPGKGGPSATMLYQHAVVGPWRAVALLPQLASTFLTLLLINKSHDVVLYSHRHLDTC